MLPNTAYNCIREALKISDCR